MMLHNKGRKALRDRAILIKSYNVMCHDFKVPRKNRMDAAQIARLSTEMLYKINKDLYSQATPKQAYKLAIKTGQIESEFQRRKRLAFAWIKGIIKPARTIAKEAANG